MKGVFERATVHAAAVAAVAYWQAAFDKRKADWIDAVALRTHGWLRKRPIGRELAEKCFEAGFMGDYPARASGGVFWLEFDHIITAMGLVGLTERGEPKTIILDDGEIATLRPVLPEAAA